VKDKQALVDRAAQGVGRSRDFLHRQGESFRHRATSVGLLKRLERMDDAINALISPDPVTAGVSRPRAAGQHALRAVKPDPAALEFRGQVACLRPLPDAIRAKLNPNPADISMVMGDISKVLDAPSPA
jgi:type I restriction enzyme R subunit